MSRALPEWRGRTPDSAIPPRVRLRVFQRCDGRCGCCNRKIVPGEAWDLEHTVALINGGEHRESNMRPWIVEHHKDKTRADVAEKSRTYRMARRHAGVKKPRSILGWRKFSGEVVRATRER